VAARIAFHADVVGSLLRPPELREARRRREKGEISAEEFRAIEDRAVDRAIALQESAGLDIVTDGELRRESFQSRLAEAASGFGAPGLDAFLWGEWRDETGVERVARPEGLGVRGKLVRERPLAADEFRYLRARTDRLPKVTLPSPGLAFNFWSEEQSAYATVESFFADVVGMLRAEVAELSALGASYIQLDAPHYGLLLDPRTRGFYERGGWSLGSWLDLGVELDNAVMAGFPEIVFALHV
jgi:5-methyltetrahydropteroyltriglutamate--homocysteine methyltransferase